MVQGLLDEQILTASRAGTFVDIGAAFGSETAVGYLLGFSVEAFETRGSCTARKGFEMRFI